MFEICGINPNNNKAKLIGVTFGDEIVTIDFLEGVEINSKFVPMENGCLHVFGERYSIDPQYLELMSNKNNLVVINNIAVKIIKESRPC